MVRIGCAFCGEYIYVRMDKLTWGIGLYLSHLLTDHWEALNDGREKVMKEGYTPGAWMRIAGNL